MQRGCALVSLGLVLLLPVGPARVPQGAPLGPARAYAQFRCGGLPATARIARKLGGAGNAPVCGEWC